MSRLPPLNALRAFEAAARRGSFTGAAEELGVTSAAVGQQVRGLEARLDMILFRRGPEGLALTAEAAQALPHIRAGFDRIAEGVASLTPPPDRTRLAISVAPTFAMKWLVPRLHRFYERHAETELSFDTSMRYADVAGGEVDLGIRFGPGRYPGLNSERLLHEVVLPLCAPKLCHGKRGLRRPLDLERATLLHVAGETGDTSWPDWRRWGERYRLGGDHCQQGPRFTQSGMALQAAVEGQGVALCGITYALDEILAGKLLAPFGTDCAVGTRYAYDMVHAPARAENRPLMAFRRWAKGEAVASRRLADAYLMSNRTPHLPVDGRDR